MIPREEGLPRYALKSSTKGRGTQMSIGGHSRNPNSTIIDNNGGQYEGTENQGK